MNPFTRFLRQWTGDRELHAFVEHCDALEALVVRVFKAGRATAADDAEYQALRRWLATHYQDWKEALQLYWQESPGAEAAHALDPLEALLDAEHASDFAGDWRMMQRLPAVREALNRLVLKHSRDKN